MKKHALRAIGLCALAVGSISYCTIAATATDVPATVATAPATQKSDPPVVVSIKTHPAAIPRAPFAYRVLPDLVEAVPGNAAQLYLTAIQLLPGSTDSEFWKNIDKWVEMPLADLPRDEIRKALPVGPLHLADLAAHREHCHWEIPWRQDGVSTLLPHLSPLRSLARLLVLRAKVEIADGKFEDAARSIQSATALGLSLNDQPFLIQSLVCTSIEALNVTVIEAWISQPGSPNLYWGLTELPRPFADIKAGMNFERVWIYTEIPASKEAVAGTITAAQWDAVLTKLAQLTWVGAGDDHSPLTKLGVGVLAAAQVPQARKLLIEDGMPAAQVNAMEPYQAVAAFWMRSYDGWMQTSMRWYQVPFAEGWARAQQDEADFNAQRGRALTMPLAALLPSLTRAHLSVAKLDRRIAALRCVEAVRAHAADHGGQLPASLDEVKALPIPPDPITGKAFRYTLAAGGFTLEGVSIGMHGDVLRYEVQVTK